jgi:DNA-binding MarR family transcriptional regulator
MTDLTTRRATNLGRLLFRGYRVINARLLEELSGAGHTSLRLGHVGVLSNLDFGEGTRLVTLAERAGVTKQAIGPVVGELESLGYLLREPDPSDGRAKLVNLTAAGKQVIELAQPIIDRIEESVRANLGPVRFDQLIVLLGELLAGFDEGDAHPQR